MTLGMLVGWSSLGVAVGLGTVYIEENQEIFQTLTWIGAAYIAYLGWNVATSNPKMQESEKTERLGFKTGLILQIVNGKACCLLYTSPSPRDYAASRMPSSA